MDVFATGVIEFPGRGGVRPPGKLVGLRGGCLFIPGWRRNPNVSGASAVLSFDISVFLGIPQDIEGSLGELTPVRL